MNRNCIFRDITQLLYVMKNESQPFYHRFDLDFTHFRSCNLHTVDRINYETENRISMEIRFDHFSSRKCYRFYLPFSSVQITRFLILSISVFMLPRYFTAERKTLCSYREYSSALAPDTVWSLHRQRKLHTLCYAQCRHQL